MAQDNIIETRVQLNRVKEKIIVLLNHAMSNTHTDMKDKHEVGKDMHDLNYNSYICIYIIQ